MEKFWTQEERKKKKPTKYILTWGFAKLLRLLHNKWKKYLNKTKKSTKYKYDSISSLLIWSTYAITEAHLSHTFRD